MIFLRPWFLLCLPLLGLIAVYLWRKPGKHQDWYKLCDKALLVFFQQGQTDTSWRFTWAAMMLALLLINIALSGPAWQKQPMKMTSIQEPVIIILDLSTAMLQDDISPNRLQRSKMLIQDLLLKYPQKQWGFLVFSNMAYVVTPITTDIQHIMNFLPVISPNILPAGGYQIDAAINTAKQLLTQSGYTSGQLLVMSSKPPTTADINLPTFIDIAWVNVAPKNQVSMNAQFPQFNIKQSKAIKSWLDRSSWHNRQLQSSAFKLNLYHDEGRWFLAVALLPLILVFRKGWLIQLWG